MRKGGSVIDRWSVLGGILSVVLFVSGCGQAAPAYEPEGEYAGEPDKINTEIAVDIIPEETEDRMEEDQKNGEETEDRTEEDQESGEENAANVIVGTWKNISDPEREWMTSYKTCFSPDGQVVHYGGRNVDIGTWIQEGDIYTAYFDDCTYIGIRGKICGFPSYTVTFQVSFSEDGEEMFLARNTDKDAEVVLELEQGRETAWDHDDYSCPLYYESDFSEIYDDVRDYWPKIEECGDQIRRGLLDIAEALGEGDAKEERAELPCTLEEVVTFDFTGDGRDEIFVYAESLARHWLWPDKGAVYILSPAEEGGYTILAENTDFREGYTDILAPDGTELLSLESVSNSSWKYGIRYHLGCREGQIVVDRKESYSFHWDYPLINYVNDFKNGIFSVYVARNPLEGVYESYGCYIDTKDSIKIDEEAFEPVLHPFTEYHGLKSDDYPAVYFSFHPFPNDWWQDGGRYPEDGEDNYGVGMADWIDRAKDEDPDEMLREAVERSGYQMERVAYPWTKETKKNVTKLLRCSVADYYYISDDHAAYYALGEVRFDEIER